MKWVWLKYVSPYGTDVWKARFQDMDVKVVRINSVARLFVHAVDAHWSDPHLFEERVPCAWPDGDPTNVQTCALVERMVERWWAGLCAARLNPPPPPQFISPTPTDMSWVQEASYIVVSAPLPLDLTSVD